MASAGAPPTAISALAGAVCVPFYLEGKNPVCWFSVLFPPLNLKKKVEGLAFKKLIATGNCKIYYWQMQQKYFYRKLDFAHKA